MQVAIYDGNILMDRPAAEALHARGVPVSAAQVRGAAVYAIPHHHDAVVVLRNMGLEMPTPMKSPGYAFTGRFPPFVHQIETADFLAGYGRAFCLNDPGTGKTSAAIWAAEYLMNLGLVRRVVVLCPLSCVRSVWFDELFSTVPHRSVSMVLGESATKRKIVQGPSEWLIMNHDAIKTLEKDVASPESGIDLFICDEATAYKNASAARSKALERATKGRRLWLLTGTPIPQNPVDAHFMCRLVNPESPRSESEFRLRTMTKVSKFKWVPRKDATQVVSAYMQPAIRFAKSDCLDMPAVVFSQRQVDVTGEQRDMIDMLRKEWLVNHNGVELTAPNAAVEAGKVLQILQGSVRAGDDIINVDAGPRLTAMLDAVLESPSKSVVFVPYRAPMELVRTYLEMNGVSAVCINGDTPSARRAEIIREFQNLADPRVIVAHPKTTSHGVTLTAASTTIWYGPTYSGELYEQANNRTNRPGQRNDMRVIMLWGDESERAVYRALQNKGDTQGALLDIYRRQVGATVGQ